MRIHRPIALVAALSAAGLLDASTPKTDGKKVPVKGLLKPGPTPISKTAVSDEQKVHSEDEFAAVDWQGFSKMVPGLAGMHGNQTMESPTGMSELAKFFESAIEEVQELARKHSALGEESQGYEIQTPKSSWDRSDSDSGEEMIGHKDIETISPRAVKLTMPPAKQAQELSWDNSDNEYEHSEKVDRPLMAVRAEEKSTWDRPAKQIQDTYWDSSDSDHDEPAQFDERLMAKKAVQQPLWRGPLKQSQFSSSDDSDTDRDESSMFDRPLMAARGEEPAKWDGPRKQVPMVTQQQAEQEYSKGYRAREDRPMAIAGATSASSKYTGPFQGRAKYDAQASSSSDDSDNEYSQHAMEETFRPIEMETPKAAVAHTDLPKTGPKQLDKKAVAISEPANQFLVEASFDKYDKKEKKKAQVTPSSDTKATKTGKKTGKRKDVQHVDDDVHDLDRPIKAVHGREKEVGFRPSDTIGEEMPLDAPKQKKQTPKKKETKQAKKSKKQPAVNEEGVAGKALPKTDAPDSTGESEDEVNATKTRDRRVHFSDTEGEDMPYQSEDVYESEERETTTVVSGMYYIPTERGDVMEGPYVGEGAGNNAGGKTEEFKVKPEQTQIDDLRAKLRKLCKILNVEMAEIGTDKNELVNLQKEKRALDATVEERRAIISQIGNQLSGRAKTSLSKKTAKLLKETTEQLNERLRQAIAEKKEMGERAARAPLINEIIGLCTTLGHEVPEDLATMPIPDLQSKVFELNKQISASQTKALVLNKIAAILKILGISKDIELIKEETLEQLQKRLEQYTIQLVQYKEDCARLIESIQAICEIIHETPPSGMDNMRKEDLEGQLLQFSDKEQRYNALVQKFVELKQALGDTRAAEEIEAEAKKLKSTELDTQIQNMMANAALKDDQLCKILQNEILNLMKEYGRLVSPAEEVSVRSINDKTLLAKRKQDELDKIQILNDQQDREIKALFKLQAKKTKFVNLYMVIHPETNALLLQNAISEWTESQLSSEKALLRNSQPSVMLAGIKLTVDSGAATTVEEERSAYLAEHMLKYLDDSRTRVMAIVNTWSREKCIEEREKLATGDSEAAPAPSGPSSNPKRDELKKELKSRFPDDTEIENVLDRLADDGIDKVLAVVKKAKPLSKDRIKELRNKIRELYIKNGKSEVDADNAEIQLLVFELEDEYTKLSATAAPVVATVKKSGAASVCLSGAAAIAFALVLLA